MRLRARLVLVTLGLTIPGAVAASVLYRGGRQEAELDALVAAVSARLESTPSGRCDTAAPTPLAAIATPSVARGGPRASVTIRQLEIWALSSAPAVVGPGTPTVDPELRARIDDGDASASQVHDEPSGYRAELLLRAPPQLVGCAYVFARDATPIRHSRDFPMPWLALPILSLAVVLVGLGPVVARLRRLAAAATGDPDGPNVATVPVEGDDEVADCARAFVAANAQLRNRADVIAARERTLRRYVDDTNHDIAVPLSVLRGHLARLLEGGRRGDVTDLALVRAAVDEAHYMGALLHDLATFATLERGLDRSEFTAVDLAAVVERAASRHRTLAVERQVSIEAAVPDSPIHVLGDGTCIEQAVSNLVLNAVRHHPGDGHVAVVLDRDADRFMLRVDDDGPGIPDDVLRALTSSDDAVAARPRGATGQGLGLRIVTRVADLHGWRLSLSARDPCGTRAELVGPCTPADHRGG